MLSKPLIRWAGSKRKLLPVLLNNLPTSFSRYVEPFCGSACLFFEQSEKPALLTDINPDLINALKQIKKNKNIRQQLIALPNTEDEYYRLRKLNPDNLDLHQRAIRFLYLNRYCFNGVYRTNSSGQFNVPRGTRTGDFPTQEAFELARKKLQFAELAVADYKITISELSKGDFVYLDPPYSKSNKFTGEYGVGSFNGDDLPELYKTLKKINKKGAKFLFSYRACNETLAALSSDFKVTKLNVKRHVAGFKSNWDEAEEILVKNYA